MAKYVLKRVLMAVITLFIVICLTFFLMNAIPGNPWLSEKTPSQATIDALNEKYGLDQPYYVQFFSYLSGVLQGDFGPSYRYTGQTVNDFIAAGAPVSARLGLVTVVFVLAAAIPMGILAALKNVLN